MKKARNDLRFATIYISSPMNKRYGRELKEPKQTTKFFFLILQIDVFYIYFSYWQLPLQALVGLTKTGRSNVSFELNIIIKEDIAHSSQIPTSLCRQRQGSCQFVTG
ncbi:hypothetical protein NPIL_87951 [Nephila pilipes]|uniref:Uncharacterized protein n=1 Tax=Nephila pilipes TaxID=299642 RepID=A0A8X6PDJ1_NEPPI|nr:hypothetical protein NPIL_87951 [Nephila pilipes]